MSRTKKKKKTTHKDAGDEASSRRIKKDNREFKQRKLELEQPSAPYMPRLCGVEIIKEIEV